MALKIDFSKFTFTAEQIRDINELVKDQILEAPDMEYIHQIYPGIITDKEIGFITEGGLVGIAGQGCSPVPQDWQIGTRKVVWTPKEWEILIEECATDLENTMTVYCMKNGITGSLEDTDYMAVVVEILVKAIKKAIYRIIWFSDIDAENSEYLPIATLTEQTDGSAIVGTVYQKVESTTENAVKCATSEGVVVYLSAAAATGNAASGKEYYSKSATDTVNVGGDLTPGVDPMYFNILDGYWKQLGSAVAAKSAQLVSIEANTETSKKEQWEALTPQAAYNILSKMYFDAPITMRNGGKARFLCTQSFADAYQMYLEGKDLESTYTNLTDGVKALMFRGIALIPMPIWDEILLSYYQKGDAIDNPHRVLFIEKENLAVGMPNGSAMENLDIWYNKDTRKTKIEGIDKIDAKVLNDGRFIMAI